MNYYFLIEPFVILFYKLLYFVAKNSIIHIITQLEYETQAKMPFDYTWDERYLVRIEYLKRMSKGDYCSFSEVEKEHLDEWWRQFEESKKAFEETRNKNN